MSRLQSMKWESKRTNGSLILVKRMQRVGGRKKRRAATAVEVERLYIHPCPICPQRLSASKARIKPGTRPYQRMKVRRWRFPAASRLPRSPKKFPSENHGERSAVAHSLK